MLSTQLPLEMLLAISYLKKDTLCPEGFKIWGRIWGKARSRDPAALNDR